MSDYTAIAGVSRSLQRLLLDRMEEQVDVTLGPPDVGIDSRTDRRVNLYLYHLFENSALKNQEIPGSNYPNEYGFPPLSLNLHYLMTAFNSSETGADVDLSLQQTLGDAMRVFHDHGIVTEDLLVIRAWAGTIGTQILDTSLRGEFERVKVTLQAAGIDELSKLWTALPQANFRRSVAYEVCVVQIESRRSRRIVLPVQTRAIHMVLPKRPIITNVYRLPAAPTDPIGDQRVAVGQTIVIEGENFASQKTWVLLGSLEPLVVTPVSNNRIEYVLPDAQYPIDADHPAVRPIPTERLLQPGPQLVQVRTRLATDVVAGGLGAGLPEAGQSVQGSNQAVFMLVPRVATSAPANGAASAVNLTVTGTRLYMATRPSYVLIGDVAIEMPITATPTSVTVSLAGLSPLITSGHLEIGRTYPVRVQVNGAQSVQQQSFTITGA